MFLRNVELINFKCHRSLKFNFEFPQSTADSSTKSITNQKWKIRKTTFVLGENGTGKSALLKAIALVTAGSRALADVLGDPNSWVRNGEQFCEIRATLVTQDYEERHLLLRIVRDYTLADIIKENTETLSLIDTAISNSSRNYFVVAYGASRRLSPSEGNSHRSSYRDPRSASIKSLFNADAAMIQLVDWAIDLDYSGRSGGLDTVKDALNQFLVEGVHFKEIDKRSRKLIFTTPDGDVPLNELSDGYQNVSAWVGDFLFNVTNTFDDYKQPLHARGLLLIDEIDLHLHPKWQRRLYEFIDERLPNFQIIATTHSPLTAQQASDGELFALKREDNAINLIPFVGDPSKMLIHQLLMAPIFGLETDESVKIQRAKDIVRKVRLNPNSTDVEVLNIKPYEDLLSEMPINIRPNNLLGEEDVELLKKINTELAQRQQDGPEDKLKT